MKENSIKESVILHEKMQLASILQKVNIYPTLQVCGGLINGMRLIME